MILSAAQTRVDRHEPVGMESRLIVDRQDDRIDYVSILGLGCSQVGSIGNPNPDRQVRATLRTALDLGVNLFDTADIYGQGDSERVIGEVLGDHRDRIFIATKFGNLFSRKLRAIRPFKPILKGLLQSTGARKAVSQTRGRATLESDFSPAHMRSALEGSLRRLNTDYVDALLLHSPGEEVLRDPEIAAALEREKQAGKIRHFGVSCDSAACAMAAAEMPGVGVVQVSWDVFETLRQSQFVEIFIARGIAIVLREVLRCNPHLEPAQAIKAAASQPGVTSVIAGTSNPAHLRALAEACAP